jgi:hypothetical protein
MLIELDDEYIVNSSQIKSIYSFKNCYTGKKEFTMDIEPNMIFPLTEDKFKEIREKIRQSGNER